MSVPQNGTQPAPFINPYIDWASELASSKNTNQEKPLFHPVFIREKGSFFDRESILQSISDKSDAQDLLGLFLTSNLTQLLDKDGEANGPIVMIEAHEIFTVWTEWQTQQGMSDDQTLHTELFVYISSDFIERLLNGDLKRFERKFEILDIGPGLSLKADSISMAMAPDSAKSDGPIMAVIDDGIGFLNKTFCTSETSSRFTAFWMQAIEKTSIQTSNVHLGRTLEKKELDKLLKKVAKGEREDDIYRDLMRDIAQPDSHQSLSFASSHGTMVADLAFGKKGDCVDDLDLLGVQLPPESVEDTSGMRFAPYLVMAARWILARAHLMDDGKEPLIITISMGFLAGPKNGTHFVEYALAESIERWRKMTGRRTHIVFPYGNNFETNQVAKLCHGEPLGVLPDLLEWIVLPDDHTPSYIEIRSRPEQLGDACKNFDIDLLPSTMVALRAPNGETLIEGPAPEAGKAIDLMLEGALIGRLYHVAAREFEKGVTQPAMLVFSLAPTADLADGGLLAPAGAYELDVIDASGSREFVLQIQRDDTPPGYVSRGRQSYFDNMKAHLWNHKYRDYTGLGDDGPITHEGSNSALTTAHLLPGTLGDSIDSVAAAEQESATELVPAGYSAQGGDWSGNQPKRAHIVEESPSLIGKIASGTLSGSISRLSGTSAAAPLEARHLALMEITGNEPVIIPVADKDKARLGDGIIDTPNPLETGQDRF
ncbi:MAG: hypothetical protein OIF58_14030 [Cohaesibacter sp.]|nr:hypothetical protein [Cohaesibacter sp.]